MELNNLIKSQAATDKVDRLSENKIYSSRESGCCSVWKTMIPTINSALKLSGHPSSPKVMRWFVRTYCKFMENDEGINMDMKSTKFFIKERNEQDDAPSLSFDNLYSLPQTLLTHMRQFYNFPNKKCDVSANSFSTKTSSFEHLACMISLLQPVITSPNNFMTTYKCDDYLYYHHNDIWGKTSIDEECRAKTTDWHIQIVDFREYNRKSVYVAISYLDRLLCTDVGQLMLKDRKEFQLTSMCYLYNTIKFFETKENKNSDECALFLGINTDVYAKSPSQQHGSISENSTTEPSTKTDSNDQNHRENKFVNEGNGTNANNETL